jgi:hypothetical protein
VDKSFAGSDSSAGAHKTRSSRELVAGAQSVATSPLDPVGHPPPFIKPSRVVAYLAGKRAAHAIDLIDLDTCPRRAGQVYQQSHRPPIIPRKIKECRIAFLTLRHCILRHHLAPLAKIRLRRSADEEAHDGG